MRKFSFHFVGKLNRSQDEEEGHNSGCEHAETPYLSKNGQWIGPKVIQVQEASTVETVKMNIKYGGQRFGSYTHSTEISQWCFNFLWTVGSAGKKAQMQILLLRLVQTLVIWVDFA